MCKAIKQVVEGVTYIRSIEPVTRHTGDNNSGGANFGQCKGCAADTSNVQGLSEQEMQVRGRACYQLDCMTDTLDFIYTKEET